MSRAPAPLPPPETGAMKAISHAMGLDIGGSGVKAAVVDVGTGELLSDRVRLKTPRPATPAAVLEAAAEIGRRLEWSGPLGCGFPGSFRGGKVDRAPNLDPSWAGCDLAALRAGSAELDPARIRAYFEVHIEQAPLLVDRDLPVGIVTGIRGDLRYRYARCFGVYGHSGALAREQRQDAVAATVELVHRLNMAWRDLEDEGKDLVFTVGELTTDPANHGPSKVAGETRFVLDIRGLEGDTMRALAAIAEAEATRIGEAAGVRFDLGKPSYCEPAIMDKGLRVRLVETAAELGCPALEMASGAGHDAAVFTEQGVPSAMIFIRNRKGSHNPDEEMAIDDFAAAARLLSGLLTRGLD